MAGTRLSITSGDCCSKVYRNGQALFAVTNEHPYVHQVQLRDDSPHAGIKPATKLRIVVMNLGHLCGCLFFVPHEHGCFL